jgi:hypothetical protein
MVQQIVARRDSVEHLPHRARRTRLIARTRRPRPCRPQFCCMF